MRKKDFKILLACEESGTVRDAFLAEGFTGAVSCDLQPSASDKGNHYQGRVEDIIGEGWDLIIAHPPCTYLCNSGVRWLFEEPGRMAKMRDAANFFKLFLRQPCLVCVENPIPHGYAMVIIKKHYSQKIQPWQFGHGETKATCLWLVGLPPLQPTDIVSGREQRIWKMPPSEERSVLRSKTYPGVAHAMAVQWGGALLALEACQTAANKRKPKRLKHSGKRTASAVR